MCWYGIGDAGPRFVVSVWVFCMHIHGVLEPGVKKSLALHGMKCGEYIQGDC